MTVGRIGIVGACWMVMVLGHAVPRLSASFDEVLESLVRASQKAEHAPHNERIFRRVGEVPEMHLPKASEEEVLQRFNRLEGVDEAIRKDFQSLPMPHRVAVVELGEASQRLLRQRENGIELLRKLDTDGLAQLRTYGNFVGDGVEMMGPDYKTVVRKTGGGAGRFYQDWIAPHKGKWLAAGLISAYLAAPEKFHDALGKLTEYGAKRLTEAGIDAGAGISRGFWKGIGNRFSADPMHSTLGVLIIVVCASLFIPRVRWLIRRSIQPLLGVPKDNVEPTQGHKRTDAPEHFRE